MDRRSHAVSARCAGAPTISFRSPDWAPRHWARTVPGPPGIANGLPACAGDRRTPRLHRTDTTSPTTWRDTVSRKLKGSATTTPFGCAICGLPNTPTHDTQWRRGEPTHQWKKPNRELISQRARESFANNKKK